MATKYFNVKNGLSTGGVLVADGNVTLGSVANVHITGGTDGYLLKTNGSGTLSWVDPQTTQSAAPMPLTIQTGDTLTIDDNYQGLFGTTITVDGTLAFNGDGILVDVSGQGPPGSNSQISFNDQGSPGATDGFTFNKTNGNMSVPGNISAAGGFLRLTTISKSALNIITGVIGQIAILTDSNPAGQMVYWDATNNRWAYVYNNSAVI